MSTGSLPIVSRAQLDALAVKFNRVREGLDLAKKRGVDEARLLDRIESGGPTVAREDFLAACAMLGPAVPLLFGVYASRVRTVEELCPLLQAARRKAAPKKSRAEEELARGAWALSHAATILVDSVSRDWVRDWADIPELMKASPWTAMTGQCAIPFVLRAAWVAARLGKPVLASYKNRYVEPAHLMELREAGWGLVAMALRHAPLRGEIFKLLRAPPSRIGLPEPARDTSYVMFAQIAQLFDEKEATLREEGMEFGRKLVAEHTHDIDAPSPYRFSDPALVPDELALPALFGTWYDAHNGERGNDVMIIALAAAASARGEDFYYPAAMLRDVPPDDLQSLGESLVEMQHKLLGPPKTVRADTRPGRNDPCPCGSGRKFKKCHGA
jgi:hypothetical protein